METSLLFGGESLSGTSCNGGAESGVSLGLAAGAESETSPGLALGALLLVSMVSYSFFETKCRGVFWWFFYSPMSVSRGRKGSSFLPLKWKVGNGYGPLFGRALGCEKFVGTVLRLLIPHL